MSYETIYVRLTCIQCDKTWVEEETDVTGPRRCIDCNSIIEEDDATIEEFRNEEPKDGKRRWYN